MIEKRAAQRYRVFKGATITFENSGITCTVRNMSANGAAIDLDALVTLPRSFTLAITRDNFYALTINKDAALAQAKGARGAVSAELIHDLP